MDNERYQSKTPSSPERDARIYKRIANWMLNEMREWSNERGLTIDKCPLPPEDLRDIVEMEEDGIITHKGARQVFKVIVDRNEKLVKELSEQLTILLNDKEVMKLVDEHIKEKTI